MSKKTSSEIIDSYVDNLDQAHKETIKRKVWETRRKALGTVAMYIAVAVAVIVALTLAYKYQFDTRVETVTETEIVTVTKEVPIEVEVVKEVVKTETIYKEVEKPIHIPGPTNTVTNTVYRDKSIVLEDGTKVNPDGTVQTPDGKIHRTISTVGETVTKVISKNKILGASHYVIFTDNDGTPKVTTGYRYDLSESVEHPRSQYCYYSSDDQGGTKGIAQVKEGQHDYEFFEYADEEAKALIEECKWLREHVTSHFTPVDNAETDENKRMIVEKYISLFGELAEEDVSYIQVNYGRFEDELTLGTCFLKGYEMQISVDRIAEVSEKKVGAIVFHELAHCVYGMRHTAQEGHIMGSKYSPGLEKQTPADWMKSIQSLR